MKRSSLLIFLILAGCLVGPDYVPPENTVADNWNSESEIASGDEPLIEWWKVFDDPLLNQYIAMAAEHNNDVLTATSNILQARALRQVAASSFYPQLGADVNATRTYFSKNGPIFAIGPSEGFVPGQISPETGLPFTLQVPQTQNLYNVLFDASWELDLFGKTRRTVEAADAVVGSAIEDRNNTLLSVMAEIARNYIELRSMQKRSALIEENIGLLEKKAVLIHKQYETGYTSRLDDENILATLAAERALLPDITAQIYRDIYTLSVLTGSVPEVLVEELIVAQPLPKSPDIVSVGLRSDLLRRRPDIRRAERNLAATTANIGVAIAAFFPVFNLIADGGLQSLMLNNLFNMGSRTWAIAGDVNMPIFEGGRLVGNVHAKRAETAAAAFSYQQIVLTALEEAESAIVSYKQDLATRMERGEAVSRYQTLVCLSRERNAAGLISLLNYLDVERQLNQSEQELLDSQTAALIDLIALYKALGGGWQCAFETEEK